MIPDRHDSSKSISVEGVCMSSRLQIGCPKTKAMILTLTILEVIKENMKALTFDAVIFDDDAGAADNLSGITVTVNLAEPDPGAELFCVRDFDEVDLMFGAEGFDELDVLGFGASLHKNA